MQSHVLFEIAEQFNALGIRWGVGGSNVLAHHGIIDSPRDLDLIVHLYDAKPALERLEQYGAGHVLKRLILFVPRYFKHISRTIHPLIS